MRGPEFPWFNFRGEEGSGEVMRWLVGDGQGFPQIVLSIWKLLFLDLKFLSLGFRGLPSVLYLMSHGPRAFRILKHLVFHLRTGLRALPLWSDKKVVYLRLAEGSRRVFLLLIGAPIQLGPPVRFCLCEGTSWPLCTFLIQAQLCVN